MRTPSSARRLRSRPPRHRPIAEIAHLIDAAHVDDPDHLVVHVSAADADPDALDLGVRSLPVDVHPFAELAGLVAPAAWTMFGLRVHGTGHHLEERRSERAATTFLMARSGEEVTLLRMGGAVAEVPETAHGTLPDLCRRVLGCPTAPPPASTGLVFTLAWLDSVLERWGDPQQRRHLTASFATVAACHPAVTPDAAPNTPERLVPLARAHAVAWPWARLREVPDGLAVPGGTLPPDTATWMDDGFFARWTLGAFPDPAALVSDVTALLGADVGAQVQRTVLELLDPNPASGPERSI